MYYVFPEQRVIADEERPFKFMDPFNGEVWRLILVSSILVGVYVSLLNKLSPYDHHGEFIYTDYVEEEKVYGLPINIIIILLGKHAIYYDNYV